MRLPDLLPLELHYCTAASSLSELFDLLQKKLADIVLFFEVAAEDETWADQHGEFMQKIMLWMAEQLFLERFPSAYCQRIALATRQHFSALEPFIPEDLTIQLQEGSIAINTILMLALSDFFPQLIRQECIEKKRRQLPFQQASEELFKPIKEFAYTGRIELLWRNSEEEIIRLLRFAASWSILGVVELCEKALAKYISGEQLSSALLRVHRERWPFLKRYCIERINASDWGIYLSFSAIDRLSLEFKEFSEQSLARFQELRPIVTDLVCSGHLVENSHFSNVLQACPVLIGVDISGSSSFSDTFKNIPTTLKELNLARCLWLSKETIKHFAVLCPHLTALTLTSNTHLNFTAWGELIHFKELRRLDLARCHQIRSEELLVILKACSQLLELSLDGCDKISDNAFFELPKSCPRLARLVLSRTSISNTALVEIIVKCPFLTQLDLSYCEQITEKALLSLKHANALKELTLVRTNISSTFIEELKISFPNLSISY